MRTVKCFSFRSSEEEENVLRLMSEMKPKVKTNVGAKMKTNRRENRRANHRALWPGRGERQTRRMKDADDGPVEEEEGLALGDDNDLSEVAPSSLLLLVGAGWCSARATMIRCTNCCRKKMNWGKMTSMQSLERRRSGCRYTCLILLIPPHTRLK